MQKENNIHIFLQNCNINSKLIKYIYETKFTKIQRCFWTSSGRQAYTGQRFIQRNSCPRAAKSRSLGFIRIIIPAGKRVWKISWMLNKSNRYICRSLLHSEYRQIIFWNKRFWKCYCNIWNTYQKLSEWIWKLVSSCNEL